MLNPLHQSVYEEYAELAEHIDKQNEMIRHFVSHPNEAVREMFIRNLMQDAPSYSEKWKKKLDIITRDVNNSQRRLQEEVSNCVNRYKLCRLDLYLRQLREELKENHPEEIVMQITAKYQKLIARKNELAQLLGAVVTH